MSGLVRPYGFRCNRSSVGGSVARASDANESMMRFTHRSCVPVRGLTYNLKLITNSPQVLCKHSLSNKITVKKTSYCASTQTVAWATKKTSHSKWELRTKGSCKLRVDAGGEDWRHWKNLLENRFTKETTCLPFSLCDFLQFITTYTFICCVKQVKQELISWAHSSLSTSIFEISKTGQLFAVSLVASLSRSVWFYY